MSNNSVGTAAGLSDVASDAEGGGIHSTIGALTINNSAISGNRASASAPNGRFADSGALFLAGGALTMSNSSVTNNSATLAAAFPSSVDVGVHAGAIHFSQNAQAATVSNTTISGNAATMTNSVGDSFADHGSVSVRGGGIDVAVGLTLRNTLVSGNTVFASGGSGSALGGGIFDVAFPDGPDGPPGGRARRPPHRPARSGASGS